MKSKPSKIFLLSALILVGCSAAPTHAPTGPGTGALSLSTTSIAFAGVAVGSASAAQQITLTNTGTQFFSFTNLTLSDVADYQLTTTCGANLAAGASCTASVIFSPKVSGNLTASLSIVDTLTGSPQSVSITGTGIQAVVTLSPSSLSFGSTPLGTASSPQQVQLTNAGNAPLAIAAVSIADSTNYVLNSSCGANLAAGVSCLISITFKPQAAGVLNTTLNISDNLTPSPQTVSISGTSTQASAALSVSSLNFDSVVVGSTSASSSVKLTNTGNIPLALAGVALSDLRNYSQTNNCVGTLAVAASCSAAISFNPQSVGLLNASLTFSDNASNSPQIVTLSGTGLTPQPIATLSSQTISFANAAFGATSGPIAVTLTNTGTALLSIAGVTLGGTDVANFAESTTCGATLAISASCTISVTFSPSLLKAYSAAIQLTSNASNSPQIITVSGSVQAPKNLHALGDSITLGQTLTPVTLAYPYLMGTDYGQTVSDYGVSGAQACDLPALEIFPNNDNPVLGSYPLYTVMVGSNDVDGPGTGSYETIFNACHQASLAWLGLPADLKVLANTAGVTTAGGGTFNKTDNYNTWETNTLNASITFPITTTATGPLYLWVMMSDGDPGTFQYAIDGKVIGTSSTGSTPAINTHLLTTIAPAFIRVPGIVAGNHNVVFTQTSSTGTMQILAVGAPPAVKRSLPTVIVGDIPLQESTTTSHCVLKPTDCAQYDDNILSNIGMLAADGLDIRYAENNSYMLGTPPEMNDFLHPNALGQSELRQAFEAPLASIVTLSTAPIPVISLSSGTYSNPQSVTISDTLSGADIYYTTDGSAPSAYSTYYAGPIVVTNSDTISALALEATGKYGPSPIASVTLHLPPVTPTISPSSGSFTSTQTVTLSDLTSGASIYYTTDGSAPTASSTLYSGPITISSTETVKAVAINPYGSSAIVVATYIIHLPGYSSVLSGSQLVKGATIQLYQVGIAGYGSAAKPLFTSSVESDAGGNFSFAGKYSCTPGSYLYMTAAGGTVGSATSVNPNLALMAVVGLCDNLTGSTVFVINEATTVAAAYALAQFSGGSTFGTTLLNQPGSGSSAPADNFATSSANVSGLANAMSIAQLLASSATGVAPGSNGNASAIPEWWQVNLIANLLAACGNSTGGTAGDGSSCGTLFTNVATGSSTTPKDTIQAALALALKPAVPTANIANLYRIISSPAPFQPFPVIATAITDLSIGIEYVPVSGSTPLLNQPSAISFDSLGNAWVGNQPISPGGVAALPASLVELTPTGVPIQAGVTAGAYVVSSYTVGGTSQIMGGQYANVGTVTAPSYQEQGLYVPAIDSSNNVWFNDRYNSAIGKVTGSGTAYSKTLSYQNGGNAGATGTALGAYSWPVATYVDGNNSVWFNLGNLTKLNGGLGSPPATCQAGVGSYTSGIGVFIGGDSSNTYLGSTNNDISAGSQGYLAIDPNKNDTINGTEIVGAPFIWTIGTNGNVNLIVHDYTSGSTSTTNPTCNTPLSPIGYGLAAGETGTNPGHTASRVLDLPNPATAGDYLHFIGPATDWTFDKAGNFWIANYGQTIAGSVYALDSNNTIFSAISKVTPSYGNVPLSTSTPNSWGFNVFHNVAGMFDGSATSADYPSYLASDGGGNIWFALSKNFYVSAITNTGAALSPNTGATNNTTAGFAGSICSCTFNGDTQSYHRPNAYNLSRPSIDPSGNVWIPASGSGSTYVDVLVGIAIPRAAPDSLALKNGTFASLP